MTGFRIGGANGLVSWVASGGVRYPINPGARNMLTLLEMLADEDVAPSHRAALLLTRFYTGAYPADALDCFMRFATLDAPRACGEPASEPDFDYVVDAMEIYASFRQLYGVDLLEGGDMHWWRFQALLRGCFLSDCALREKIRLRHINPSECQNPAAAAQLLSRLRIQTPQSEADRRMQALLNKRLLAGQPICDLQYGR